MKRFAAVICAVTLLFLAAEILWLKAVPRISENRVNARSVTVNRLNDAFEKALSEGAPPDECIRQLLGPYEKYLECPGHSFPCVLLALLGDSHLSDLPADTQAVPKTFRIPRTPCKNARYR